MLAMVKRKVLIITIFALLFSAIAGPLSVHAAEASWLTNAPMPTARLLLGVAAANGKIYAIGGSKTATVFQDDTETNVNEEYDPSTNTWTQKAPMLTARSAFAITVYQNKIYVIGGYIHNDGNVVGTTEVYDPTANTWTTKTPMPTPRFGLSANVVNDKIYLSGGSLRTSIAVEMRPVNVTEVYDPTTDSWTTQASMPKAVYNYASAVVNGKIYVINGVGPTTENGIGVITSLVQNQIYNPQTNTWSIGASVPTPSSSLGAGVIADSTGQQKIFVVCGTGTSTQGSTQLLIYDPKNNTWSTETPMPTFRLGFGVAALNNNLYAIGGATQLLNSTIPTLATNEEYSPTSDRLGTLPFSSSTPAPSPTPTTTTASSPSLSPTSSANLSPSTSPNSTTSPSTTPLATLTPTPSASEPTKSEDPITVPGVHYANDVDPLPLILGIVAVVIVAITIVGLAAYFTKYRKKKTAN